MYFQLVRACVQPTGRKNRILVRFLREPPMRWGAVMATVAIWQREPDGRPLYAYKCRDEDYERLKEMVCEQMPTTLSGEKAASLCGNVLLLCCGNLSLSA
jgi:hypothetical protein